MTAIEERNFIQGLIDNEDYRERAAQITEPQDLIALASDMGITLVNDDAVSILNQVHEYLEKDELSDEALDLVSGGALSYLATCALFGAGAGAALAIGGLIIYGYGKKNKWW